MYNCFAVVVLVTSRSSTKLAGGWLKRLNSRARKPETHLDAFGALREEPLVLLLCGREGGTTGASVVSDPLLEAMVITN